MNRSTYKLITDTLGLSESYDILSEYRERILYLFGLFTIAFTIPITIINMFKGQIWLVAATYCMLIILGINSYYVYKTKSVKISQHIFFFSLLVLIFVSMMRNQTWGVFWTFPTVLFITFSVSPKQAKIYILVLLAYFSTLTFWLIEFQTAFRAVTALVLTIIFLNHFLNLVNELQQRLFEQSNTDPLTGALNRRLLFNNLEDAIERKKRSDTPATLMIFDLDHFKSINDRFGHEKGDEVLKLFTEIVQKRKRPMDQFYRLGGEEFLLFLPDTKESGAVVFAEEIRLNISEKIKLEDHKITVSIGVSELEEEEMIENWIDRADKNLYIAKQKGRNRTISKSILQFKVET